jgi:hypothetical protein
MLSAAMLGTVMLSTSGCAGYQLGERTMFRPDISTVYIPTIRSDSFRRNLGERLTEAVVKELESKSSYKVVADPNADSTLQIRLVSDTKRVIVNNQFSDVRDAEVDFFVQVSWINQRGDLLATNPQGLPIPPILSNVGEDANFIPEAGQSISTAQQEVINRLAAQIVGMMEAGW